MADANAYTYRVYWSDADGEYVGTCAEFPLLSYCGSALGETLGGIVDVVEAALQILAEDGREAPDPLGSRPFSGRLVVRMPPELHRRLAIDAATQGVSLNRLITERLASTAGAA